MTRLVDLESGMKNRAAGVAFYCLVFKQVGQEKSEGGHQGKFNIESSRLFLRGNLPLMELGRTRMDFFDLFKSSRLSAEESGQGKSAFVFGQGKTNLSTQIIASHTLAS